MSVATSPVPPVIVMTPLRYPDIVFSGMLTTVLAAIAPTAYPDATLTGAIPGTDTVVAVEPTMVGDIGLPVGFLRHKIGLAVEFSIKLSVPFRVVSVFALTKLPAIDVTTIAGMIFPLKICSPIEI